MPFLEGRAQGRGNPVNSRAKSKFASQARVIVETHAARQKPTLIYVSEGPLPLPLQTRFSSATVRAAVVAAAAAAGQPLVAGGHGPAAAGLRTPAVGFG